MKPYTPTAEDVLKVVVQYITRHAERDLLSYPMGQSRPVYMINPDGLLDELEKRIGIDGTKAKIWEREAKESK